MLRCLNPDRSHPPATTLTHVERRRSKTASVTWILPGTPLDAIRLAVFTVSPPQVVDELTAADDPRDDRAGQHPDPDFQVQLQCRAEPAEFLLHAEAISAAAAT